MIKMLRVDDKLLHGQVAFSWVRNLKIHTIVIADDHIAYDEFMKMTLGLSKPNGVKLEILEIAHAIEYLTMHSNSNIAIMAIVNRIEHAYRIMECIQDISSLNLGAVRERYDALPIAQHIALTKDEIALCKDLIRKGKQVEIRMRFDDEVQHARDVLEMLLL